MESVFMASENTTQYHKYIITYNNNMVVEEEVTEIPEVVENFIGFDPIQSHLLPNSPQIQSESPSHESSIVGVNIINNRDQSSVMAAFPPINHEGLHISFHTHHENYPEFDRSLPAGDFERANSPLSLPIHCPRAAACFNFVPETTAAFADKERKQRSIDSLKINQLLRQIAQMNEILLAVHNIKAAPST